jgi:hypothetical protein
MESYRSPATEPNASRIVGTVDDLVFHVFRTAHTLHGSMVLSTDFRPTLWAPRKLHWHTTLSDGKLWNQS